MRCLIYPHDLPVQHPYPARLAASQVQRSIAHEQCAVPTAKDIGRSFTLQNNEPGLHQVIIGVDLSTDRLREPGADFVDSEKVEDVQICSCCGGRSHG